MEFAGPPPAPSKPFGELNRWAAPRAAMGFVPGRGSESGEAMAGAAVEWGRAKSEKAGVGRACRDLVMAGATGGTRRGKGKVGNRCVRAHGRMALTGSAGVDDVG